MWLAAASDFNRSLGLNPIPGAIMRGNQPTRIPSSTVSDETFDFGGLGVCWKIDGPVAASRFSIVHHSWRPMRWRRRCTGIRVKRVLFDVPGDAYGKWRIRPVMVRLSKQGRTF